MLREVFAPLVCAMPLYLMGTISKFRFWADRETNHSDTASYVTVP